MTLNPKPEGNNKVSVQVNYFNLVELETVNAEGILNTIKESFKGVKINYLNKLGLISDCATLNRGAKTGNKTILQRENELPTFGWCVANKLRASTQDAFMDTVFNDIRSCFLDLLFLQEIAWEVKATQATLQVIQGVWLF